LAGLSEQEEKILDFQVVFLRLSIPFPGLFGMTEEMVERKRRRQLWKEKLSLEPLLHVPPLFDCEIKAIVRHFGGKGVSQGISEDSFTGLEKKIFS